MSEIDWSIDWTDDATEDLLIAHCADAQLTIRALAHGYIAEARRFTVSWAPAEFK